MNSISILGRTVSSADPMYVIAEISANHNGSLALAKETVHASAEAGADAIKLQTYRPDTITFNGSTEPFRVREGTAWDGRTLFDLYEEGQTPWEWHAEIFELARSLGMHAFSSPFDPTAVDFLADLQVPAFKIASFEITDIPLIRKVAALQLPVILSTGISREADIALAVGTCREMGNDQIAVLKCTSFYPAPLEELNLRTVADIPHRFNVVSGISDHTMGTTAAVVARALGASILERHIILDRSLGGLDSQFSTDANEFAELVQRIRETEVALGAVNYELTPKTAPSRRFARSLFIVADVKAGETITENSVRSIRPADGIHPSRLPDVIGRSFARDLDAGTPLAEDHII
jgi:pseudaminic acid synthase